VAGEAAEGVILKAELAGLGIEEPGFGFVGRVEECAPKGVGVAGPEREPNSELCHFPWWGSSFGEEQEREVEEEEVGRLEVSASASSSSSLAEEAVMSWGGLECREEGGVGEGEGVSMEAEGSARTVFMLRDFLWRSEGVRRPDLGWVVWLVGDVVVEGSGLLFWDRGRRLLVLLLTALWAADSLLAFVFRRSSTSLGLKTTLVRNLCTASSRASSMAQWFLIMLIFGQVALSPESIAWDMKSGVGFESIRGKST